MLWQNNHGLYTMGPSIQFRGLLGSLKPFEVETSLYSDGLQKYIPNKIKLNTKATTTIKKHQKNIKITSNIHKKDQNGSKGNNRHVKATYKRTHISHALFYRPLKTIGVCAASSQL